MGSLGGPPGADAGARAAAPAAFEGPAPENPFTREPTGRYAAGARVGEYEVLEVIGQGGMGTVYRARHPASGKQVAIKVLRGGLSRDATSVERFLREARTINAIRHRCIVDVLEVGRLPDDRYFFVMEYLEGKTLRAILGERQRLPLEEALPIFIDVAHALEAAHKAAIVHRDLKPDNVLLASAPGGGAATVKLLDFGVAKLLEASDGAAAPLTALGATIGTPHYMAPEQCRAGAIDGRADIYALGVMLYETVTGIRPFDGRNPMEIFWAHVNKRPIRPMRQAPDLVSPELDQVIMKALAKSPDARFQTAGEVRHALETLARRAAESGSGVRAAPTLEVPITRARKNVVIVVGVGVAAALALVWLLRG